MGRWRERRNYISMYSDRVMAFYNVYRLVDMDHISISFISGLNKVEISTCKYLKEFEAS